MARLLLHICCGPCAIHPVQRLQDQGFEVTGLFTNPNIHPLQEYLRRREGVAQTASRLGVKVIYKDDEHHPQAFFRAVAHREANRCFHCYAMRLERTHAIARRGGFQAFSTTLLYSVKQQHEVIAQLGRDVAGNSAVVFHHEDWREGWAEGIRLSKAWGVYRQQYCGCLYSEHERYAKALRHPPTALSSPSSDDV